MSQDVTGNVTGNVIWLIYWYIIYYINYYHKCDITVQRENWWSNVVTDREQQKRRKVNRYVTSILKKLNRVTQLYHCLGCHYFTRAQDYSRNSFMQLLLLTIINELFIDRFQYESK